MLSPPLHTAQWCMAVSKRACSYGPNSARFCVESVRPSARRVLHAVYNTQPPDSNTVGLPERKYEHGRAVKLDAPASRSPIGVRTNIPHSGRTEIAHTVPVLLTIQHVLCMLLMAQVAQMPDNPCSRSTSGPSNTGTERCDPHGVAAAVRFSFIASSQLSVNQSFSQRFPTTQCFQKLPS